MNRMEHARVQLGQQAHGFQGVVQPLLGLEIRAETNRHALERHLGRQALEPRIELRLKGVAVRAAVPKEFHHLDLARCRLGGRRLAEHQVILARHPRLGGGRGAGRRSRRGCGGWCCGGCGCRGCWRRRGWGSRLLTTAGQQHTGAQRGKGKGSTLHGGLLWPGQRCTRTKAASTLMDLSFC